MGDALCSMLRARTPPTSGPTSVSRRRSCKVYLSLPYHVQWDRAGVGAQLNRASRLWLQASQEDLEVGLAWRLGDRHMVALVKSWNSLVHEDYLSFDALLSEAGVDGRRLDPLLLSDA